MRLRANYAFYYALRYLDENHVPTLNPFPKTHFHKRWFNDLFILKVCLWGQWLSWLAVLESTDFSLPGNSKHIEKSLWPLNIHLIQNVLKAKLWLSLSRNDPFYTHAEYENQSNVNSQLLLFKHGNRLAVEAVCMRANYSFVFQL